MVMESLFQLKGGMYALWDSMRYNYSTLPQLVDLTKYQYCMYTKKFMIEIFACILYVAIKN